MRVLVVEDDIELQGQLQRRLLQADFHVNVAGTAAEALFYAAEYTLDLAIVDLGLPEIDGIELIKRLREEGRDFPILILTARSGWKEKVRGLDAGADDYLTKPFQAEELAARINALVRRSTGYGQKLLSAGPIALDAQNSIVYLNGEELSLTAFEFKVLDYFMNKPRKVITKFMLIDHLYDDAEDRESNVIEVIIARLRKKLDPDGSLQPIETLRGRGYRFMNKTL